MKLHRVEYKLPEKYIRITPWWKFWETTFWKTQGDFWIVIETDEFLHKLTIKEGFEMDKRTGPFWLPFYPKWGSKNKTQEKRREGWRTSKINKERYNAKITWHDGIYHDVCDLSVSEVGELFDVLGEWCGMSDFATDIGQAVTKKFGKWGGSDERSNRNRELIVAQLWR